MNMKDWEFEFRVDVFYSPEYRAKFYELLSNEKSKGNLSIEHRVEETAPPPELIKDIVLITASSLTIIKILYDFLKDIKKKKGKILVSVSGETFDLETHSIDEVKVKIESKKKPSTRKYFCRFSFPSLPQEEIRKSARTLADKPIFFNGSKLPYPDNRVFFAEEVSRSVEAIVYVRDKKVNELCDKGRPLYATAEFEEAQSIINPDERYPVFTNLLVSSTVILSGCKMKEIVRKEDYPEWYRP